MYVLPPSNLILLPLVLCFPPPSLIYFLPSFLPPWINSSLTSPPSLSLSDLGFVSRISLHTHPNNNLFFTNYDLGLWSTPPPIRNSPSPCMSVRDHRCWLRHHWRPFSAPRGCGFRGCRDRVCVCCVVCVCVRVSKKYLYKLWRGISPFRKSTWDTHTHTHTSGRKRDTEVTIQLR